jgi:hypothetical protein
VRETNRNKWFLFLQKQANSSPFRRLRDAEQMRRYGEGQRALPPVAAASSRISAGSTLDQVNEETTGSPECGCFLSPRCR